MCKTALVTGGAGGIGSAVCQKLADDGFFVVVGYLNSAEKAETLSREIGGAAVRFDVSDRDDVFRTIEHISNTYGDPGLLVNNAGVSHIGLFQSVSAEDSLKIFEVDLMGTLNCSRAVLPAMIRNRCGCIINISSMWGQCGASCEADYSASKAGVIGFTKALAKEVAPSGIRVNCIAPGFIMTGMNSRFSPQELEDIRSEIPLGAFGEPRHIADAVSFLASPQSEYITGQTLAVNGGMVI